MLEFAGAASPLGPNDIARVAAKLGVEPATIAAVCDVESAGSGFLPDKQPKILFERHLFHRLTGGRYDAAHPGISNASAGGYGASGAHQYDRLAEAIACDRQDALQSASWGRFQILGMNFKVCGFAGPEAFVAAMVEGEANHLAAFAAFCKGNNLVRYLVSRSWSSFAAGYNGPGNVADYGSRLAAAYQKHKNDPIITDAMLPQYRAVVAEAEKLQQMLRGAGLYAGAIDGDLGPLTRAAVNRAKELADGS